MTTVATTAPDQTTTTRRFTTVGSALVAVAGVGIAGIIAATPASAATHSTATHAAVTQKMAARFSTIGLAVPGGNPAAFKAAKNAGITSTWSRLYRNGSVPVSLAKWPQAKAAAASGSKLWLSLALPIAPLTAGSYDAQLTRFVKTLPAGTRLTTNHEPSNKAKHISPKAFDAAWNHAARVILTASHGKVLPGPIEVQANVIRGKYLNGLNKSLVKFVGLDAYDGIAGPATATRSFKQVTGASFAYTRKLFPNAPVGFAEFNSSRKAGWAKWVATSLAWCKSVGADTAVLFTSLGQWHETTTQLRSLSKLLAAK